MGQLLWLIAGVGLIALGYVQALNPDRQIWPMNAAAKVVFGPRLRSFRIGVGLAVMAAGLVIVVVAAVNLFG